MFCSDDISAEVFLIVLQQQLMIAKQLGQLTFSVEISAGKIDPIMVARSLIQKCILGAHFFVAHG